MGFSWSSAVAQEALLALCREGRLTSDFVIAPDAPLPDSFGLAFSVATDDLMVFSDRGPGATLGAVSQVEAAMLRHGVIKNPDKDIEDALTTTCVGVDLVNGSRWSAPGARIWSLLDGVVDLSACRTASPGGVAAYIGVAQWYDLIRRLRLSVFRCVYDFSSGTKAKDWDRVHIPDGVLGELLLDATFLLFGTANMQLPFLDFVAATDASSTFGIGGAVACLPDDRIRQVARLASKRGGHVLLSDSPALEPTLAARLGPARLRTSTA
jgi:hypothetical protein